MAVLGSKAITFPSADHDAGRLPAQGKSRSSACLILSACAGEILPLLNGDDHHFHKDVLVIAQNAADQP